MGQKRIVKGKEGFMDRPEGKQTTYLILPFETKLFEMFIVPFPYTLRIGIFD